MDHFSNPNYTSCCHEFHDSFIKLSSSQSSNGKLSYSIILLLAVLTKIQQLWNCSRIICYKLYFLPAKAEKHLSNLDTTKDHVHDKIGICALSICGPWVWRHNNYIVIN